VSTQINVTVGSGGLSDKARQLQTAARQAQLEKERQQRIEAEGTEQRNSKLEAEGKAPDGSPLYNVPFNQPQIDRRPTAFRPTAGKFGYFTFGVTGEEGNQYAFVRSGDGLQEVKIDFPKLDLYPDALASVAALGELTGQPINTLAGGFIQRTDWMPVNYDSKGRITGSTFANTYDYIVGRLLPGIDYAFVWPNGYEAVNSTDSANPDVGQTITQTETWYALKAQYEEGTRSWLHVMPTGKDSAIVVAWLCSYKIMDAYSTRFDRVKRYTRIPIPFGSSLIKCFWDVSPDSYLTVTSAEDSKEEFHVFAVSTTKARYIGRAPDVYKNIATSHPLHVPFNANNSTSFLFNIESYDQYPVTYQSSFNCNDVNFVNYKTRPYYLRIYQGFSTMSVLTQSVQARYKTVALSGLFTTPSTYACFTDYSNYYLNADVATEQFNASYFPTFAGKLKWRTYYQKTTDIDLTKRYVYTGEPPVSWGPNGPQTILTGFPSTWKKESSNGITLSELGVNRIVWDWDNPSYCRAQAKALGFSDADLTP
jgi:hypothetical protein